MSTCDICGREEPEAKFTYILDVCDECSDDEDRGDEIDNIDRGLSIDRFRGEY